MPSTPDLPGRPLPVQLHVQLHVQRYVAVLRDEAARCSELGRRVDHDVPLAHLPGWTVGDCLAHLVGDFRWAASILADRAWNPSGIVAADEQGHELVDALDAATALLVEQLERAVVDLSAPCPNFAEGADGRVAFWFRRQAHETTVHRWDLETPTGRHEPIEAELAADGIDESLAVYTRRYGGQVLDRPLVLACDDVERAWRIAPATIGGDATRVTISPVVPDRPHEADTAEVRGPAAGLLLVIQHRLDPDAAGLGFGAHEQTSRAFLGGPLVA